MMFEFPKLAGDMNGGEIFKTVTISRPVLSTCDLVGTSDLLRADHSRELGTLLGHVPHMPGLAFLTTYLLKF